MVGSELDWRNRNWFEREHVRGNGENIFSHTFLFCKVPQFFTSKIQSTWGGIGEGIADCYLQPHHLFWVPAVTLGISLLLVTSRKLCPDM